MRNSLLKILIGSLALVILTFAVVKSFQPSNEQSLGSFNPTGGTTYRLFSSIGTANSSITLSSFKEPISNIPYTMSYLNSSIEYGTLSPQSSTSEFISFTGITQNTNGTATLTGVVRGLSRTPAGSSCVASSTLAQTHAGQSTFILSDSPCFFTQYYTLSNNATSTGILAFSSTTPPRLDSPGAQASGSYIATTSEFVTWAGLQAVSFAGVTNAAEGSKGISQLATQIQSASSSVLGSSGAPLVLQARYATSSNDVTGLHIVVTQNNGKINWNLIDLGTAMTFTALPTFSAGFLTTASSTLNATTTANANTVNFKPQFYYTAATTITGNVLPQPVYIATSTGSVSLSSATVYGANRFDGFAISAATNGNPVLVQTSGVVSGFTGLTAGADYYAQSSAGTISTSIGTAEVYVGTAISTTQLAINLPSRGMQYLGSQSLTCPSYTPISVPYARFAIVNGTGINGSNQISGDVTISAVGKTAGTIESVISGTDLYVAYTWIYQNAASSSIQVTRGTTCSTATIYYYR